MKKNILVVIVLGFLLMLSTAETDSCSLVRQEASACLSSYTPHGNIMISSDVDFEAWPGSGTNADPYVIEGLNISSAGTCILIENTRVHFKIIDCLISFPSLTIDEGIVIENVTNGIVDNCIIEMRGTGILLESCSAMTLSNNNLDECYWGIFIEESNNIDIVDNVANCNREMAGDGFLISNSVFNRVEGNTAVNYHRNGISLQMSDHNTIKDNNFTANSKGAWMYLSKNNVFMNNIIQENINGMLIEESSTSNIIENNMVLNNIGDGFTLLESSDCIFDGNLVDGNDTFSYLSCGFNIESSENTTLSNNRVSEDYWMGLSLADSSYSTVIDNIVDGGSNGIGIGVSEDTLGTSDSVYVGRNLVSHCGDGIGVGYSEDSIIENNTVTNCGTGFEFPECVNLTIRENTAFYNAIGITLSGTNNMLYLNTLVRNGYLNARDNGNNNLWDDDVSQGNYWDDYDGTGDYEVPGDAGSVDRFPIQIINASIDNPEDVSYLVGTTGITIQWTPSATFPYRYTVYRNGTNVQTWSWDGSQITVDVDGLSVGVYNYTIVVFGEFGSWASDTVYVTVTDSTTPDIDTLTLALVAGGGIITVVAVLIVIMSKRKS